ASPIEPSVPDAVQQALLEKLLGTRLRDLDAVEEAHRRLLAASPALHRRLLNWLACEEPDSPHLAVGLALLATGPDPAARLFVADLVDRLPVGTVAAVVDYVHGWYLARTHVKRERRRFQDEMTGAYRAAAGLVRDALRKDAVGDDFRGGEILVTLGQYDRVQQVLDHLQLPYQTLPCQVVETLPLRGDQVLIINCPGQFSAAGLEAVRRFVAAGGTLV